jgi:hypothetical protein
LGLAPQALGLASPPPLVPPPLLASPLLVGRRDGLIPQALSTQAFNTSTKKAPHEAGLLSDRVTSDDAAASVAPNRAVRADAGAGPYHDDRCGPHNNDGAAIGLASAIGAAMKAGAASARGIRCAEACERAGDQNCCEKVLHVFSRFLAAGRHGLYPSNGDLNGE